ncbi:S1 RNA-binding domain-containing protein [Pseudenhygromyxa sp. WMMC2535]|uniref:S1 RNA-binding domain-containing protein n=1 Tax=Pseudenhygromyxa sp. WMMC2535 TaxID=2712867 RepID=UPI001552F1D7|nr:S1 RNA-binding domain-containing protein [Pseudenhygromyxa sp. WMMC2535]NVB42572.1 S1 RNA-binding domain-containing protein [Pseudenhygromyxa sp. WMMC2535]
MVEDEDFAALFEQSGGGRSAGGRQLSPGESVQGTVVQIGRQVVFVDVGTRSEGEIDRHELEDRDGNLKVAIGDRLRLTVARGGDKPKLVTRLGAGAGGVDLELALESGAPISGTVTKAVKGGLEVSIGKARAFCPASHVHISYTPDISIYEGQTLDFRVIEVRDNGRSVIVSRKALLQEQRAEAGRELLASLSEGAIVEGTVQTIQPYGAFVDLGGAEGLVHISELGHGRVERVEDVVSVGEQIRVKVLNIEVGAPDQPPRISLSLRQASQGSGDAGGSGKNEQAVVDAEVVRVEAFGVFIETATGAGIVPTRELDLPPGGDPRRAFPVGKQIRVVAMGSDDKGRTRYSIRRVEEVEARSNYNQFRAKQRKQDKKADLGSFGELLKQKLN